MNSEPSSLSSAPATVQLRQVQERTDLPPLLLAEYVPPTVGRALQEEGIAFADAAGNAYLDGPAAYVWISGHRPAAAPSRSGLTNTDLQLPPPPPPAAGSGDPPAARHCRGGRDLAR